MSVWAVMGVEAPILEINLFIFGEREREGEVGWSGERLTLHISAIFCDAHGSEGQWYLQPATSMTSHDGYIMGDNGHPILYNASGGHGHYG